MELDTQSVFRESDVDGERPTTLAPLSAISVLLELRFKCMPCVERVD